ncbi:MAG TPA: DUF6152 family protein [Vicinamibacterales bacterium]|jgi:hypothetical protein|nr:DUF6152 family protein [Vicinamibacterales bacterium]
MRTIRTGGIAIAIAVWVSTLAPAASAHHSFAMYNMGVTKVMTGKLTRFIPGSNHAQLIFEVLNADGSPVMEKGKPLVWGMETGSAAAMARSGVTVESFPPGTIMTVTLHPLRDGRPMGAVGGPIVSCGMTMPSGGCNEKTGKLMTAPAN